MENYQEIKKLGSGSFGVALLVKRKSDGKLLVSKRMRLCGMEQKERDDAMNEVRLPCMHLLLTGSLSYRISSSPCHSRFTQMCGWSPFLVHLCCRFGV